MKKNLTYHLKTHVAIYDTKEMALNAVDVLTEKKFPLEKVSMVEKGDVVTDKIKVTSIETIKLIPISIFILIGMILGILASLEVVTFPGLDFLKEAPVFIGAFVGFNLGLIIGTLTVISITLVTKRKNVLKSYTHLEGVKYLIVVTGTIDDIEKAEEILHTKGTHKHRLVCNYCNAKQV